MTINDLYNKYNLMPQLREHQLRVGGIVKIITNDWEDRTLSEKCVVTALVHDMGNIVKFKLSSTSTMYSDLEYWRDEQKRVQAKYGIDANTATEAMLTEVGLDWCVRELRDEGRAYNQTELDEDFFKSMSKPALLTLYGDMRVSISGIVSMQERIRDLEERYGKPRPESSWAEKFEEYIKKISPIANLITEDQVEPLFDALLTYPV